MNIKNNIINTYQCNFTPTLSLTYSERNAGSISLNACWAQFKSSPSKYTLIRPHKNGIHIKYINEVVEIVNKVTPCILIEKNNQYYISIKLLDDYSKSLFMLNLIRLLWWNPKCANVNSFLKELIEKFNSNKEQDIIELITTLIIKHYDYSTRNYNQGAHCFFYKDTKKQNLSKFNKIKTIKDSLNTMKNFLCS